MLRAGDRLQSEAAAKQIQSKKQKETKGKISQTIRVFPIPIIRFISISDVIKSIEVLNGGEVRKRLYWCSWPGQVKMAP